MKKTFNTLLGFFLLFLFGAAIFFTLKVFWQISKELNETQKTLFVVTLTLLAPIIGTYVTTTQTKKREFEMRNREKKERTYDNFVAVLYEYLDTSVGKKREKNRFKGLIDARKNLVVWGSDEVVKVYSDFMKYTRNQEKMDEELASQKAAESFENLIKAIRIDLGYKNKNIISGDITRYFT